MTVSGCSLTDADEARGRTVDGRQSNLVQVLRSRFLALFKSQLDLMDPKPPQRPLRSRIELYVWRSGERRPLKEGHYVTG